MQAKTSVDDCDLVSLSEKERGDGERRLGVRGAVYVEVSLHGANHGHHSSSTLASQVSLR